MNLKQLKALIDQTLEKTGMDGEEVLVASVFNEDVNRLTSITHAAPVEYQQKLMFFIFHD